MSNIPEAVKPPVNVNEVKSDGRDSRLQRTRKNNEEVLRKKLQNEARDICASQFTAFGACAKEHSLMVIHVTITIVFKTVQSLSMSWICCIITHSIGN
jgi:hypothetical protein